MGKPSIKNDGVRQWGWDYPIYYGKMLLFTHYAKFMMDLEFNDGFTNKKVEIHDLFGGLTILIINVPWLN